MKRIVLAALPIQREHCPSFSQDSTKKDTPDTIKIGGMVIIKKGDKGDTTGNKITIGQNRRTKESKPANQLVDSLTWGFA